MNFHNSKEKGKSAERFAEMYFTKNNIIFEDVRESVEWQGKDVDYIANNEAWEVKLNLQEARKGKPGLFFWVELDVSGRPGWWHASRAEWFMFVTGDSRRAVAIRNDAAFNCFVNNLIEHGKHGENDFNRYDYKKDIWYNRLPVTSKCMRVYLAQLEKSGVDYKEIATRRKRN